MVIGTRAGYQSLEKVSSPKSHPGAGFTEYLLRTDPRVVKRKMSKFHVKRATHRRWPQPTRTPEEAARVLGAI